MVEDIELHEEAEEYSTVNRPPHASTFLSAIDHPINESLP